MSGIDFNRENFLASATLKRLEQLKTNLENSIAREMGPNTGENSVTGKTYKIIKFPWMVPKWTEGLEAINEEINNRNNTQ